MKRREFLTLLRECLSGETVTFQGDFYDVKRFRLGLKLGDRRYLEILAPDPAQDRALDVRGLYKIESPRLLEWAAHVDDLDPLLHALEGAHIESKPVFPGSRKRPDGKVLRWKALNATDTRGGVLPFFIEWSSDSPHPASDSPAGCELSSFSCASSTIDSRRAGVVREVCR